MSWAVFILLWINFNGANIFSSRFASMLLAILLVRLFQSIFFLIVGIIFKWLVIGRYAAGRHRLWGGLYLRWWIVNQALRFCGRGLFDISNEWRCRYYRALGAKIGARVKLSPKCRLTEFDLVYIGDDSSFDAKAIISPFCADAREMMLRWGNLCVC